MAYTMYMAHKRADAFEDFVGEVLDYVYTSAGEKRRCFASFCSFLV